MTSIIANYLTLRERFQAASKHSAVQLYCEVEKKLGTPFKGCCEKTTKEDLMTVSEVFRARNIDLTKLVEVMNLDAGPGSGNGTFSVLHSFDVGRPGDFLQCSGCFVTGTLFEQAANLLPKG